MKTIIHVDQAALRRNKRIGYAGPHEPPITVKTYRSNQRAKRVAIHGPCTLVYSPTKPLPCGATVWIETHETVEAI